MKQTGSIARHSFASILSAIVATLILKTIALGQVSPSWIPTGSLNIPRSGHTATLLPNGKVLVVGGNSSELYDPATGTWSVTGSLNTPRYDGFNGGTPLHTATLLPNGKVLVAGGITNTTPPDFGITTSAELYDPVTGTWSVTGSLNIARFWHTATLLQSGKVLVAGGGGSGVADNSAELYDPATGKWSTTGNLIATRYGQTATLLQNGKVLIAGGSDDGDLASTLASAELYDPVTGTWSVTGNLNASRFSHTATLLPDGKVLAAGGFTIGSSPRPRTSLNSAELYDPANGTWSIAASLNMARDSHTATLLPNGKVLVAAGGYWTGNPPYDNALSSAELYDPATGVWSITAGLNPARFGHTATRLQNGQVLIAGGSDGTGVLNSAELYDSHLPAPMDFDGDGRSDITVYRDGIWYVIRSSDGAQSAIGLGGMPQDIPAPGDYDGDGKTDIAVYRDGTWFIKRSSDEGLTTIEWGGAPQDIPVPGDYDGDGKTDIAVYRDGTWFIKRSSDEGLTTIEWGGAPQDIPVPGDYDGDGKTDIALYRDGTWFIRQSSDNLEPVIIWGGMPQDIPVPADYDGDGKTDIAIYRDGTWFIKRSSDNLEPVVVWGGAPQDIPVPRDYDGDGKADMAVYRDGTWFILRSSDGLEPVVVWGGAPQDIPLK